MTVLLNLPDLFLCWGLCIRRWPGSYSEGLLSSPSFLACLPSPEFWTELRLPTNVDSVTMTNVLRITYDCLNRGIRDRSFEQLKNLAMNCRLTQEVTTDCASQF